MKFICHGCEDSCTLETSAEDIRKPNDICPWGLHCNAFSRDKEYTTPCMWVPVEEEQGE